jgi:hypothetical protein
MLCIYFVAIMEGYYCSQHLGGQWGNSREDNRYNFEGKQSKDRVTIYEVQNIFVQKLICW